MTGLLWGLETLAWSPDFFARAISLLGELAALDTHTGNWANRPENSLATILLPWLPQTMASLPMRRAAVRKLLGELPAIGWRLLIALLPGEQQASMGTRKPMWRGFINDDWSKTATASEYREQLQAFGELAVEAAKGDVSRLLALIKRFGHLPPNCQSSLLNSFGLEQIATIDEAGRLAIWTELIGVINMHRKFAASDWSMDDVALARLESVAKTLEPTSPVNRHRRLFSERDFELYEDASDFNRQSELLEQRRRDAVSEIYTTDNIDGMLRFATAVETPWRVGSCVAAVAGLEAESSIIPLLLAASDRALASFAGGFVWTRFRKDGWPWVDGLDVLRWKALEKAQFLAFLPFNRETWGRATAWLGTEEPEYWAKANANPYETGDDLPAATDLLLRYGRPGSALKCIEVMQFKKLPIDCSQAARVLKGVLQTHTPLNADGPTRDRGSDQRSSGLPRLRCYHSFAARMGVPSVAARL